VTERELAVANAVVEDRDPVSAYRDTYPRGNRPTRATCHTRVARILSRMEVIEYISSRSNKVDILGFAASAVNGNIMDTTVINGVAVSTPARLRDRIAAARLYADVAGLTKTNVEVNGGLTVNITGADDVAD